jgi:phage head maturation protease
MGQPQIKSEVKIGMFQIRADLRPASFDNKNRTVDVVMSSGYRGQRYDWMSDSSYMEELDISDAAIRKVRLDAGLPVLTNHSSMPGFAEGNQKKLMNVGVVSAYRIENGQLVGTLKMSRTQDVEPILQDLEDGIIRSVSLGYRVYKYIDISTPTDEMKIFRAVDWEPMEVSLVSLPFDPLAQVRNAPSMYSAIVETKTPNEGEEMSKKTDQRKKLKNLLPPLQK